MEAKEFRHDEIDVQGLDQDWRTADDPDIKSADTLEDAYIASPGKTRSQADEIADDDTRHGNDDGSEQTFHNDTDDDVQVFPVKHSLPSLKEYPL